MWWRPEEAAAEDQNLSYDHPCFMNVYYVEMYSLFTANRCSVYKVTESNANCGVRC